MVSRRASYSTPQQPPPALIQSPRNIDQIQDLVHVRDQDQGLLIVDVITIIIVIIVAIVIEVTVIVIIRVENVVEAEVEKEVVVKDIVSESNRSIDQNYSFKIIILKQKTRYGSF